MREMLLLGAGASVEAGIPGAYKMTERIAEVFRSRPYHGVDSRVLAFVIGGLLFKRGIEGEDALCSGVNVEELFNAVQLLADRGRLEASPFVGSWHAMVEELDTLAPPEASLDRIHRAIHNGVAEQIRSAIPGHVSGFGAGDIDRNMHNAVQAMVRGGSVTFGGFGSLSGAVGKYIEEYIKQWTNNLRSAAPHNFDLEQELRKLADQKPRPGQGRVFEFVAEHMISTLIEIVWIKDPSKVEYLRPLFALAAKQNHLVVATLNYDNSVELAAKTNGAPCETGITSWSQNGKLTFPAEGITLLKLHGSIEWEQYVSPGPEMIEHLAVRPVNLPDMQRAGYRPAVIFGHRNKLTADGPFLDLLQAFVQALDDADLLTLIGYSFGDPHINTLVARWLNGKSARRVRIVNRSFNKIKSKLTDRLAKLGSQRLEILHEDAGVALPKLYGELRQNMLAATEPQTG